MRHTIVVVAMIAALAIAGDRASAEEYLQLSGVVHVHSTFSSGEHSIEDLANRAGKKGLGVLVVTDHDQVVMEYGLFPFRKLLKRREERPSVLLNGPEDYLAEIERLNRLQSDVMIIPGVQSSPFYYWTGSPFGQGLTAHDFRKELLVIGMSEPADYYGLPVLHGRSSTKHIKSLLPGFLVFLATFLLSIYLIRQKGKMRLYGLLIALFSLTMMVERNPFSSSRFDPYHGNQGETPYQDVIDYARSRGGLVFWAHPESNYSKHGIATGPVKLMTGHYPDALLQAENYTGFAALYADRIMATKPGRHWDRALMEYCLGTRAEPVWGIAEADFHGSKDDVDLDTFQTVFLIETKARKDVLEALARGRMYAVQKGSGFRLSLDRFWLKDDQAGAEATLGEELFIDRPPVVEGRLSATDGGRHPVAVSILRGGEPCWSFEGQTPLKFRFVDDMPWSGKTYYRLQAAGNTAGQLLSNPIFVVRNRP